jgi:hypothetical protein
MKNADFLGQLMAMSKYPEALGQMLRIATDVRFLATKEKIEPLYNRLEYWVYVSTKYTNRELQAANLELKGILQSEFFSELQLGIIPTSTLATEKNVPSQKALGESSSHI